jgi:hypothetical protein
VANAAEAYMISSGMAAADVEPRIRHEEQLR